MHTADKLLHEHGIYDLGMPRNTKQKNLRGIKRDRENATKREREGGGETGEMDRAGDSTNTKAGLTLLDTMEMTELEDFNEGPIQQSAGSPYWRELL